MAKFSPDLNRLRYLQISSYEGRKLQLDERPAVYAWFRSFSLTQSANSQAKFLASLDALQRASMSDLFAGNLGFLYSVSVQERPLPLSASKMVLLTKLSNSDLGRQVVARIIDSLSELQSPLYVGKADNLLRRIGEHVEELTPLSERLKNAGIAFDECELRFKYFDLEAIECLCQIGECEETELITLFEDVLTRLAPAPFVRRPG